MQKIPITAYVERFLANEFGPGPYKLDELSRHPLRLEFLSVAAHSSAFLTVHTLGSCFVQIEGSNRLKEYYAANQSRFERGVFGLHLFFQAFYSQVSAAAPHMASTQDAIIAFLEKYGICEDDYALGNAWRQYLRLQKQRASKQVNHHSRTVVIERRRVEVKVAPPVFRLESPFFSTPIVSDGQKRHKTA